MICLCFVYFHKYTVLQSTMCTAIMHGWYLFKKTTTGIEVLLISCFQHRHFTLFYVYRKIESIGFCQSFTTEAQVEFFMYFLHIVKYFYQSTYNTYIYIYTWKFTSWNSLLASSSYLYALCSVNAMLLIRAR